jgi:hypothetical protein
LGGEPTVWAEALFADPIADIAVLGSPEQEARAYKELVGACQPLPIERMCVDSAPVQVFSLQGQWLEARVEPNCGGLSVEPPGLIVPGMSGSPILSAAGCCDRPYVHRRRN